MAETKQNQGSDGLASSTAGVGAQAPLPLEIPSTPPSQNQKAPPKATGPRTAHGKKRASLNSLRHGIFSRVIVIPGESKDEYQSLLKKLSEAMAPEGALEKLIVEKMAITTWRLRRVLQAEAAEIELATNFMEWDQEMRLSRDAEIAKRALGTEPKKSADKLGLILEIQNPEIVKYCVRLLVELQNGIKSRGLDESLDCPILALIYGGDLDLHGTLRNFYMSWLHISRAPGQERHCEGYATAEECRERVLREIDAEITRLRDYCEVHTTMESERTRLEILRRNVPVSERLEVLMRYEASLERSFDRELSQYERIQRLRRGQPLAPRIDVNIST